MGVGHVPPGAVPHLGSDPELPRREHRGGRAVRRPPPRAAHLSLGDVGEAVAARVLADRGLQVLAANLRTRDGEIDLIVGDRSRHWIVEVKCGTTDSPLDRIDDEKEARLWRLARAVRAEGVLLVEVRVSAAGVLVGISPG